MYAIRPATPEDRPAVLDLVVRHQADPARHIGYHGTTAAEVADELDGIGPDWAGGAVVGVDADGVVGAVLSIDTNPGVGRAWLLGPYVEVPEGHPVPRRVWHDAADELLDRAVDLPRLAGIADQELFGHRKHHLLGDFAARHGFAPGEVSRVFALTGPALRSVLVAAVPDPALTAHRLTPGDPLAGEVAALHESLFPNRTSSGKQLVDGERGHTAVALCGADGLIGYAAGYVQPGEFYVDYVGVVPGMRSAGSGRTLVRALLRELASTAGPLPRAAAVVALGNDASERMFTALGFDLALELVPYRRRP